MNPLIQLKTVTLPLLILSVLACFAPLPMALALLPPPPPDGGYPNRTTAEGDSALFNLTTGFNNTANGFQALFSNTGGFANTAVGSQALFSNTATGNTATGASALFSNTNGSDNTANGFNALLNNTTGFDNMASGAFALLHNKIGAQNTACGSTALNGNTEGFSNTAIGAFALESNTAGSNSTATGVNALLNNQTGNFNTANGANALSSNTSGSSNVALGINAGRMLTTGSNNIDIGNVGVAGESNKIRIGTRTIHTDTFIAGIFGAPVVNGTQVFVNPNGRLGTMLSSARFKEAIKPMDKASEAILALKPVTFRYKKNMDPAGTSQFGLVAEDVEKVNPDLVVRDEEGKPYSVRYDQVNAMLLNEFLKEHRKVEQMEKQIEALTAGLQKVSAQLELSKPAPQAVLNNR
jgi:hypothetical protein